MKILVTGANGFIGRRFCQRAAERGHAVLGLVRRFPVGGRGQYAVGDLANPPWPSIRAFRPEVVVHFAWMTTPGEYLHSRENYDLLTSSQVFLQQCLEAGIGHIAGVGTCAEYASASTALHEISSPVMCSSPYADAKISLSNWLQKTAAGPNFSWSWMRIFYPYGPGEDPRRLPSAILLQLAAGKKVTLRTPGSIKDYIYVDDVAAALCLAVEKHATGFINIGTGRGVMISELAKQIARILGVPQTRIGDAEVIGVDPCPLQVADVERLRSLGWSPSVSLEAGLAELEKSLQVRKC